MPRPTSPRLATILDGESSNPARKRSSRENSGRKNFTTESKDDPGSVSSLLSVVHSLALPKQRLSDAEACCLPEEFYLDDPSTVARNLLGRLLIRTIDGQILTGRIVETEAYLGEDDPAAHAFAGRTARNEVIFGPPGRAYVYFIYGMHYCLNVSCEPEGQAGCVLIRALEPVAGLAEMAKLRKLPPTAPPGLLTSGPGRLCQALAITRDDINGLDLKDSASALHIADDGYLPQSIAVTPRIGIRKASAMPLRFLIAGNKFVSAPPGARRPSTVSNCIRE